MYNRIKAVFRGYQSLTENVAELERAKHKIDGLMPTNDLLRQSYLDTLVKQNKDCDVLRNLVNVCETQYSTCRLLLKKSADMTHSSITKYRNSIPRPIAKLMSHKLNTLEQRLVELGS